MKIRKWDRFYAGWQKSKNIYKNSILIYIKKRSGILKDLDINSSLKNRFKGNRCFVIGNGPSIKTQDLTRLSSEYVFTVNYAVNNKDFPKIMSNFHFWTDPNLFRVDINSDAEKYLLDSICSVKTENSNPICFFPVGQREFIVRNGLDHLLNIRYIAPNLGWLYEGFDEPVDLTKYIPQFGTVVQFCIFAAVYMGFEEIYLLGCDNTGIINTINALSDNIDNNNYGYVINDIEKQRMRDGAERNGIETEVTSYLYGIKGFRILNDYCIKRNVKIINCSGKTVIDSIQRIRYEDVINK